MKKILLLFAIAILLLGACKKPTGNIKGNVVWEYNDYVGLKPDINAKVFLISNNKKREIYIETVGIDGVFQFTEIPTGEYILIVNSENTSYEPINNIVGIYEQKSLWNSVFADELKKLDTTLMDSLLKLQEEPTLIGYISNDIFFKIRDTAITRKFISEYKPLFSQIKDGKGYPYYLSMFNKLYIDDYVSIEKNKTESISVNFGNTYF